uniref:Uncharacterized protein n=1 Tax=Fibrocapsa japonica TaxID=94617 RepID=A0A7S2V6S3_9STRA
MVTKNPFQPRAKTTQNDNWFMLNPFPRQANSSKPSQHDVDAAASNEVLGEVQAQEGLPHAHAKCSPPFSSWLHGGHGRGVHDCEVHGRAVHGREVQGREGHSHDREVHGREIHGHEVHVHEVHGHEDHGHEGHGHEGHGHEDHDQEDHAYEDHDHDDYGDRESRN